MQATDVIQLRISNEQKTLLDHAAKSLGKSRTAFILENMMHHAEEVLLARTRFTLDAKQWEAFTAALDSAPTATQLDKLKTLMSVETPWPA